MEIKRTEKEIDELLNKCSEAEENGDTSYPGMSYEQGIKNALEWALGYTNDNPLE